MKKSQDENKKLSRNRVKNLQFNTCGLCGHPLGIENFKLCKKAGICDSCVRHCRTLSPFS